MQLTALEKVCIGAKLVCDKCGKVKWLDTSRVRAYVSNGWPEHCGQTMRLVTATEQQKESTK
jgi:hypothetical protein